MVLHIHPDWYLDDPWIKMSGWINRYLDNFQVNLFFFIWITSVSWYCSTFHLQEAICETKKGSNSITKTLAWLQWQEIIQKGKLFWMLHTSVNRSMISHRITNNKCSMCTEKKVHFSIMGFEMTPLFVFVCSSFSSTFYWQYVQVDWL